MRTIFLALVVLNLVYFGWNHYHPPESSFNTPPPLGRDVKILSLLSESREEPNAAADTERQLLEEVVSDDDSASENMLTVDETERCYSLGPFKKSQDAERVMTHIEARGLSATRRSTTERVIKGHWVYLPALANHKAAVKTARELSKKGIEDYLVIARGENKNAVSLGLYSGEIAANRRLNRIRALGYEPIKEVKYREDTSYWLDYREFDDNGLTSEFWELLAHAEDKLQRLKMDCLISTGVVSATAK